MMNTENIWVFKKMKTVKILTALTVALIMTTAVLLNPVLSWGATLDYVKVGLKYGSGAVSAATVSADEGLAIAGFSASGIAVDATPLSLNGATVKSVSAKTENGKVILIAEGSTEPLITLAADQCLVSSAYAEGGIIKYEKNPYRGGLILKPNVGKVDVINFIHLEHYVYGVLAAEIGASSPIEAIKAQAVAARSFAGAEEGAHKSNGFDLCSTTHCQVYKGVSGESANTNKGTDDTAGLMIYSEGKPVNAYYAKNSGGHTQNSEDVWFASLAYLRGVEDTYAPDYPWEATMTFAELKAKLEALGHKPGEIQSVSITKRSAAGAVYTLVIKGSENTVTLQKDAIRTSLGGTNIKSLMFHFTDSKQSAGQGTPSTGGEYTYVVSGTGQVTKTANDAIYASNGTTSVKWPDAQGDGGTETGGAVETVTGGTLYFNGNGYGHGLGMQQDGAIAMGKQGLNFQQILKFYYTGIEIK